MAGLTKRRLQWFLMGAAAVTLVLTVLSALGLSKVYRGQLDTGRMRVDFNTLLYRAENNTLTPNETAIFTLYNAAGTVIAAHGTANRVGSHIDLHTLSGIAAARGDGDTVQFVAPVIRGGRLSGMLSVTVKRSDYLAPGGFWPYVLPPVLLFLVCLFLLLMVLRTAHTDLLVPAALLHERTRAMLRGDIDTPLHFDDDTEIGMLCRDFESMRDELSNALHREHQMLDSDRLLLACISHDLKTPLAAISGCLEELRDGIYDSRQKVEELSVRALRRVHLLTKLIDDILMQSKAQLGELSIVRQERYAREFFAELCADLSLDAARAGLTLQVGEIPDRLLALDARRITQVMTNLVGNSVKYTPPGASIFIAFRVEGDAFIVSVRDNGSGIAAGDLPFVFDRFYRGDAARTQNISGSGLGLCIAKSIVEEHSGRIECDSVLGQGTEVSFSLPLL